jgi:hypothetical protein
VLPDCRPRDCSGPVSAQWSEGLLSARELLRSTSASSAVGIALTCGTIRVPPVIALDKRHMHLKRDQLCRVERLALQLYFRATAWGLAAVVHNLICMTSTSGVLHDVGRLR